MGQSDDNKPPPAFTYGPVRLVLDKGEPAPPPPPAIEATAAATKVAQSTGRIVTSFQNRSSRVPPAGGGGDPRPVIQLQPSKLHEAVAALDAAFEKGESSPIYQRGGDLVHVTRRPVRRTDGASDTQEGIQAISTGALRSAAASIARFEKFNIRVNDYVPIDPPRPVIDAYIGAAQWRGVREIRQLVAAPLLRRSGSLLSKPGYDDETGLYLTRPLDLSVPEKPTREQANQANDFITEILKSFPYADPGDTDDPENELAGLGLSTAVAAMLGGLLRPTLHAAPLTAITASTPGTGKSYLSNVIAATVTGERAIAVATGNKPEEFEKALGAVLLSGYPLVCLDNMVLPLGGQLLAMAVTEPTISVRILGLSKDAKLPSTQSFIANGNNLRIVGDLARRTLMIRLELDMERPWERAFDRDPVAEILARRGEVVSALLTMSRWHRQTFDAATTAPPFAGFGDWSILVRAPLIALGHVDSAKAVLVSEDADDDAEQLGALLAAWSEAFVDEALTIHEANERAFDRGGMDGRYRFPALAAAIASISRGDGRPADGRRLGKYLARQERRIISGRCFVRAKETRIGAKWRVLVLSDRESPRPGSA